MQGLSVSLPPRHGRVELLDGVAYRYTPTAPHLGYDHFELRGSAADGSPRVKRIVVFQNHAPTRRTWVVDAATGRDDHPGTERQPLASIQAAEARTRPGDTVLIRNGRYPQTGPEAVEHIQRSGLPGRC